MLTSLPNLLTLSRIVAIPAIVVLLVFFEGPLTDWSAFAIYTVACITDFFDGYLARAWSQQSAFGRFLDPIADKLLVAALLMTFAGIDRINGVHLIAALIILCRELAVSGLREFLAEVRVSVPVTWLAKWKTGIQMLALGFLVVGPSGPLFGPLTTAQVGLILMWGAALLTIITGYDYLVAGLRRIAQEDEPAIAAPADSGSASETEPSHRQAG